MEKRIHLYVSKKHPALWLTGLLMLASVVARIAIFSQLEGVGIWRQTVAICACLHWHPLFLWQLHIDPCR